MCFCCCIHLVQFSHLAASCIFIIGVLQSFKRCDTIFICASLCTRCSPLSPLLFSGLYSALNHAAFQQSLNCVFSPLPARLAVQRWRHRYRHVISWTPVWPKKGKEYGFGHDACKCSVISFAVLPSGKIISAPLMAFLLFIWCRFHYAKWWSLCPRW